MSSNTPPQDSRDCRWLAAATLLRPQGRRGELLCEPLTDVERVFTRGRALQLVPAPHQADLLNPDRILEDFWRPTGRNAARIVVKLSGCDSILDAEALVGCQVRIAADDVPALGQDTYFVGDLVGCAFCCGDQQIGTIVGVEFPVGSDGRRLGEAAPLLAVQLRPDEEPALVPFIRAWLDHVDIPASRVTMHLPNGLLDLGENRSEADGTAPETADAF